MTEHPASPPARRRRREGPRTRSTAVRNRPTRLRRPRGRAGTARRPGTASTRRRTAHRAVSVNGCRAACHSRNRGTDDRCASEGRAAGMRPPRDERAEGDGWAARTLGTGDSWGIELVVCWRVRKAVSQRPGGVSAAMAAASSATAGACLSSTVSWAAVSSSSARSMAASSVAAATTDPWFARSRAGWPGAGSGDCRRRGLRCRAGRRGRAGCRPAASPGTASAAEAARSRCRPAAGRRWRSRTANGGGRPRSRRDALRTSRRAAAVPWWAGLRPPGRPGVAASSSSVTARSEEPVGVAMMRAPTRTLTLPELPGDRPAAERCRQARTIAARASDSVWMRVMAPPPTRR